MATKAQIAQSNKKPKFSTRIVRRCWRCGKGRSCLRKFELCRICFKEMADNGRLPGVRKSSW